MRHPAPDVARGFRLLLIALAGVRFWFILFASRAETSTADTLWMNVRAAFAEQRSYPLFVLLFGFGLVTMVSRRIKADAHRVVPLDSGMSATARDPPVGTTNRSRLG